MAQVTPRIAWQNYLHLTNTLLTASSQQSDYPKTWLLDPQKTMRWRSKYGWTIIAGFNDKLDFSEGTTGDATATLTAGNYTTGAALATEIQTRLNAAATDNTYTVTYSTSTFKFTIARATGAATISLEWSTGTNAATSCGRDIGFDTSADDTGATSYAADYAAYQSRQYIDADLGSAFAIKVLHLIGMQTLTTNGLVRLMGNSSAAFTSPAYSASVGPTGQAEDLVTYWLSSTQTYRYWRIMIDDPFQTSGFQQVGLAYLGSYLEPTRSHAQGYTDELEPLSVRSRGDAGGWFTDAKTPARRLRLQFARLPKSDKLLIETMWKALEARPRFLSLDPLNFPTQAYYVILDGQPVFTHSVGDGTPPERWTCEMEFAEQTQ